jgi:hypothetical protein
MRGSLLCLGGVLALAACGGGGGIDGPDPVFADDHPRIYMERNRDRLAGLLEAGDPKAVRFKEMVDAELGGADIYEFRGWYAALIGQLTGDARYCEYAVNLVDEFVRAEEGRVDGGGTPEVARDSYLYVGEEAGDVLLTYDWCFETATTDQKTRWLRYAAQAVWNVWNHETAQWNGNTFPWSGWSVDNPSNNYYYSFLRATMLMGLAAHGEIEGAEGYLSFFRDTKIGNQLAPTFENDLQGGGSREGTGYGVSMHRLWELYDLWQGSTGEDISRLTGHTRASMLYLMHAIVPTWDCLAPIGDHARDSTAALFDYHRNYLQELAYLFQDDPLVPEVKYLLANSTVPEMDIPFMYVYDFLYQVPAIEPAAPTDLGRAYYGPGTGVVFARSSWENDATWVNLIAGPYTESHAHRDQGSFMIYKGGWLAYDPIVESTSGIRQEDELHNLVRITSGGETIAQRADTESSVVALHRGDGWFHVAADVTAAWGGHEDVDLVQRELVFIEPDTVVVFDRVTTASGTEQIWQLNAPTSPAISGANATIDGAAHDLTVRRIVPATADASVFSWSSDGDFSGGFRLDESVAGGAQQFLHVMSIDGAVTAATRSDADGRIGVSITLADGRTATVRFGASGVDGHLTITGGVDVDLDSGVDQLPE